MKEMDGLALTRQLMARYPRPILVISVAAGETETAFQLLQVGAIDVFPKPSSGLLADYDRTQLLNKIRVLAGMRVFTRPLRPTPPSTTSVAGPPLPKGHSSSNLAIVGIGASTGGPQAIAKVLQPLSATFPLPIVCTQHISSGFLGGLIGWLSQDTQLRVTVAVATAGEMPQPGVVYFAPDHLNLEIDRRGKFCLTPAAANERHCPSVNAMFRSLAAYYGDAVVGVLLTGMGDDGAAGMQAIASVGGITIAQNEATSVIFGMPKEAIALGAVQHVLPIDRMGASLQALVNP
ncbi:chemotaxis response regulator protein-glutamate methylesterase [Thermosynechococcus sp. HN-54]|uniref:chemotaxis protein CheB n=1 Tax=Thermosynechococcus sp. HN-54 TaxID=2933959 RepID=UPI00202CF5DA|nr:chemotaxis protein CheB [Thermosynechococcus sp. HN-54]URR36072.1 chemotaxis response regulator protein-glutamate methylesterase [Thermosynechococcus sp. HN-54]